LYNGYLLDAYFTRSFYKHISGGTITYHDIEDLDPVYYKNIKWILENDVSCLDLNFSYEQEIFGERVEKELIPGGKEITVMEENKRDYVNKVCYAKMALSIKDQIESFLEGLHDLIPPELLSIFDHRELELMISGLPEIDSKSKKC
jgi:E3 ubiquitin-protein ligase HUWE1